MVEQILIDVSNIFQPKKLQGSTQSKSKLSLNVHIVYIAVHYNYYVIYSLSLVNT